MVTDEQIRDLADRIAREFRPASILLFGSHASGTANADSDVDLLVVIPFEGPRFRMAARIRASLTGTLPIDLVVRSPDELRPEHASRDILLQDAFDHGVVLYSNAA